jgi:polysaccharide biosynthesis transport protein
MKNPAYKPSIPEQSLNSITPFIPNQNIPFYEDQEQEWNFQDCLGLLQRRMLVIVGVATTLMAGVVINLILTPKPAEYESRFQMLIEPVNYSNRVVDIVSEVNPLSSSNRNNLDYESQILVLRSPQLLENSIKQLQTIYPNINYNSLVNSLRINRLGQTQILEVRYRSQDPIKVKAVLEQIAQDYLEYSQERRQTRLGQGLQYINRELPSLQNRVEQIQRELQIFQQKHNFVNPDTLASQIGDESANLSRQQQALEQELAQARANYEFLQTEEGVKALLDSYPVYQQLNQELRQVEIDIITASTLFQDENPRLITLREKRNDLIPFIQQESARYVRTRRAEIASVLKSLEINQQELQKNQQVLEQQSQQLPTLIREYTDIQSRLAIANAGLSRFLATRENLQIQVSQTELGWQLIQAPFLPKAPVASSSMVRDLLVGLGASIFLAIGTALLMDKLDHTYHNAWSIKEKVQLPLLGTIPFSKQLQSAQFLSISPATSLMQLPEAVAEDISDEDVMEKNTLAQPSYNNYATNFLEAIRLLYTNIQFLNSDSQIKSITITSAMSGDGKSTIAFHLAQIAVAMGKRVLLVDTDMRRPSIHSLSNLNNLWGLTNLITSNIPFEKVVKQLPNMKDLSIITAGPVPPDCPKLLSSEKMKGLMADFYENFDLVIYDAPPLVGLADANLVAANTDGLLMVARIDKTDRSVFERAVAELKIAPINILGLVANGQKDNMKNYYYQQTS